MNNQTVDVKIPQNYSGPEVKVLVCHDRKVKQGPTTFISFNLNSSTSNIILDQGKTITKERAYKILREKGGLTDKIPLAFSFTTMEMLDFEANPSCYSGPRSFPFFWDSVECSLSLPFTIRIHNLPLEEAIHILESIKLEFLRAWTKPSHSVGMTKILIAQASPNIKGHWQWSQFCQRPARPLETVYLDEEVKEKLRLSLVEFYESSSLYDRYGVTWKKVFLLHGPPGTGKTSTVLAMASQFQKDLAKMTITPEMSSTAVEGLLQRLPENTFLLMEDVDALFVNREAQSGLDFSTLLNLLDGVTAKRGLVLFMTTNHLDHLDQALRRPGRVDDFIIFPPITR